MSLFLLVPASSVSNNAKHLKQPPLDSSSSPNRPRDSSHSPPPDMLQRRPPLPPILPPRLVLLPCLLLSSLLLLASPPLAHAGWWSSGSKDVSALPTAAHGQVARVRLDWEGITCELKLKTKEGSKNLLSQVCTDRSWNGEGGNR